MFTRKGFTLMVKRRFCFELAFGRYFLTSDV